MASQPAGSPNNSPSMAASSEACHLPADKRLVGGLNSAVPDSPHLGTTHAGSSYFQGLSLAKDEISETALGEGFSFGMKKPPRPGQFSERLRCQPSDATKQTQASPMFQSPNAHASGSGNGTHGSMAIPRGPPLPLPELTFPSNQHLRQGSCYPKSPGATDFETVHTPPAKPTPRPASEELPSSAGASQRLGPPASANSALGHREETGHAILRNLLPRRGSVKTILDSQLTKGPNEKAASGGHHRDSGRAIPPNSNQRGAFESLRSPEKHVVGHDHVQRRSSPTSTCGDLERPVQPSPGKSRHTATHLPAQLRASSHRGTHFRQRSESRTSNVSKKRADVHKPRHRPHPERKMLAMHQVAQHWNECIQIAEDERNQANWEIERLQQRLQRQELKLSESQSLLGKKQRELENAERQCHQLEENDSHMMNENQRLSDEVEALHGQLSESQARATELREKQRQIRDKLNEAIQEQQDLYKRSQTFYEDSLSELRRENEKRVADSTKIDEALEKGRRKREEMMGCLQELRAKTDLEHRLKDETINELRRRVQEQEDGIRRERNSTESLRRQVESQELTQHSIGRVASQMESLLQGCNEKTSGERRSANLMDRINERLDALAQYVQAAEANNLSLAAINHAVQGVGDAISAQVVSAVADVARNQERAEQTMIGFGFTCGKELTDIKCLLADQKDNCAVSQALEEESKHQLRGALEKLDSRMRTAQETFERIEQVLGERFQQEFWFREDEMQNRQADLNMKLAGREERISHLEQQLQLTSEAYVAKVESLSDNRCQGDEGVQKALRQALADFRSDLENGFIHEKERSEEHIRQNQTALAALESQLRAVNDHLAVARGNGSQDSAPSISHDGNALVSKLQQQVRDLEKQAQAAEKLRDRWQRDIQTVDALRVQLREIQHRVPQVERFDTTFDKMARMNEILHSTAQYLTHERDWARQHLEEAEATGRHSGDEQVRGGQHCATDRLLNSIEVESSTRCENSNAGLAEECVLEEAPFFRRKVTVYSPAGEVLSPSPPPSVYQEQMRRRGATQPRSILKMSAASSQDGIGLHEQGMRINVSQSQYNRPVVGRDSMAAASAMVEQIRAELVPSEGSHLAWSLPTVADFERDGRFAPINDMQKSADGAKRGRQGTDDVPGTSGKRTKLDMDAFGTEGRAQSGQEASQQERCAE